MVTSITLSGLGWSPPDGRPLISNLDLTFGAERTGLVGRNGIGKTTLLRLISGSLTPHAGAVTVQGRVGVLRQLVRAAEGETIADLFNVRAAMAVLARAEAGEATEADLAEADWTLEARMAEALSQVGLSLSVDVPLTSLSGGQQTRAALASLIFDAPDVLLLDEPTNNLDRDGREAVLHMLAGWRGAAVVVSHDRELLERVDAIVELTSLGATRYRGGWTRYREQRATALAAVEHELADAEKRLSDLGRRAQASTERQARRDGAGKRSAGKGDAPKILLGARRDRSEDTAGEQARLADRRRVQAEAALAAARDRLEVLQPLSVSLASTGLPAQKVVLQFDDVTYGHEPGRPVLEALTFSIIGPERIGVVGPNGAGKTTLLGLISGKLSPWSGRVTRFADVAALDQDVSLLDPAASIRDNYRRLNPQSDENACRAALARFMFRADAALQTVEALSGGQRLRAGLACVLGAAAPPPLLLLDEPTNHLDLDSIQAVEAGLRAYDGALVVVSHDQAFMRAVGVSRRLDLSRPAR